MILLEAPRLEVGSDPSEDIQCFCLCLDTCQSGEPLVGSQQPGRERFYLHVSLHGFDY